MFAFFSLSPIELLILLGLGALVSGVPLVLLLYFVLLRNTDRPTEQEDDPSR